jgi:hypothetical protein
MMYEDEDFLGICKWVILWVIFLVAVYVGMHIITL